MVAAVEWLAIVIAIDAPNIAVDASLEAPDELVETVAVCAALATRPPLRTGVRPVSIVAPVEMLDKETATPAATVAAPPIAPVFASVLIVSMVEVLRVNACAPVTVPLRLEVVVSVTRFSETEAPIPKPLDVVPGLGSA
jgi:hypothetical protein